MFLLSRVSYMHPFKVLTRRMWRRPSPACAMALRMMSRVMPSTCDEERTRGHAPIEHK